MSAGTLTAGTVMDGSASLMNDTAKVTYTYVVQLPYLKIALQRLREIFERNGVAVTQATSAVIQMTAGDTTIEYDAAPDPELPDDFVEPLQLWERPHGVDPWVPMTRKDFLPHYLEGQPYQPQFMWFQWDGQIITVLQTSQDNDIKIDYIRELFETIVDDTSSINVVNAITWLQFVTASLLKKYIERDETAALALMSDALLCESDVLGISSRSKQTIMTRRRPFRAGWKRRSVIV